MALLQEKEKKTKSKEIEKVRQMIWIRGCTPEVIEKVDGVCQKYGVRAERY